MENIYISAEQGASDWFSYGVSSFIGDRDEQQDCACICVNNYCLLATVCDGMGGTIGGKAASSAAIRTIIASFKAIGNRHIESPIAFLHSTASKANKLVAQALEGAAGGTTIVSAIIQDGKLYWFSAGDSRLYIYRTGELLQVTRDHNYLLRLDELKRLGKISEAQYKEEIRRGDALISYLGLGNLELYDLALNGVNIMSGDVILLATDGLYKIVPDNELRRMLSRVTTGDELAKALIEKVKMSVNDAERDNATAIVIRA